jgi:hypothetical protein
MSAITRNPALATAFSPERTSPLPDNQLSYAAFAVAYLLGHGAAALTQGPTSLLGLPALPGWLPTGLLVTGLLAGTTASIIASTRAQRKGPAEDLLTGKLLGAAWVVGFAALFLAITGITHTLAMPHLQALLWPAGSGLVVGLIYLAEGAARRGTLHFALGSWLALTSTAALLLPNTGTLTVLALAGGGGYLLAVLLEHHRLNSTR